MVLLLVLVDLRGEIIIDPHLADHVELCLEPVDVFFLVHQDLLEQVPGPVVVRLRRDLDRFIQARHGFQLELEIVFELLLDVLADPQREHLAHVRSGVQKQNPLHELLGVNHLFDRLFARIPVQFLVAPVVEHFCVQKILVDSGQLTFQHFAQVCDDFFVAFHESAFQFANHDYNRGLRLPKNISGVNCSEDMPSVETGAGTRVLIVDDEENQRLGLAGMISGWGFVTETAFDGQDALEKFWVFHPQVILTDLMMPRVDGTELLRRLNATGSRVPAIMITAFGNIETALSTLHELGAFWFLEKPIQPRVLRFLLERAAVQNRLAQETERLQRQLSYQGVLCELVGNSEPMHQIFSLVRQVAPSKAAVLITGESGTGKELVARAIHQLSPRSTGPFVAVNCAALPETLMESELFGHEKGAFTGAVERRAGCFELAQGGTLLLDELAEMPIGTQAKLLRVLEDSRVRRLGGKTETVVDVRVVASTNRNPEDAIRKGLLREDLYYRLNVFGLELPPLRRRLDDVPALADAMLRDLNQKHGTRVTGIDSEVLARLQRHNWPGNVRELRNVIERAVIVAGTGILLASHLPASMIAGVPVSVAASAGSANSSPPTPPASMGGGPDGITIPVGTSVEQAEKSLILMTLAHTKNNKTRAAEILGISLKTLFNKLKEYGSAHSEVEA